MKMKVMSYYVDKKHVKFKACNLFMSVGKDTFIIEPLIQIKIQMYQMNIYLVDYVVRSHLERCVVYVET